MASSFATHLSLSLLLITILSSHARDNQFFNKISAAPKAEHPEFLPETENRHGLYGRDSAAAVDELNRRLPKNYNPESYVTEPEDANEMTNTASDTNTNTNNLYDGEKNYHFTPEEKSAEDRNAHFFNRAGSEGSGPQGMSDTRALENGKYFYDINSEKYSTNHPYESMKNNYYVNGENRYEFNGGKNSVGARRNRYDDNNHYYYRNGENGNEFYRGRSSVGGYENQGEDEINENYRP